MTHSGICGVTAFYYIDSSVTRVAVNPKVLSNTQIMSKSGELHFYDTSVQKFTYLSWRYWLFCSWREDNTITNKIWPFSALYCQRIWYLSNPSKPITSFLLKICGTTQWGIINSPSPMTYAPLYELFLSTPSYSSIIYRSLQLCYL